MNRFAVLGLVTAMAGLPTLAQSQGSGAVAPMATASATLRAATANHCRCQRGPT